MVVSLRFRKHCNRCVVTNLDRVPVLSGEGVDRLLLEALLALGESLVPEKQQRVSRCILPKIVVAFVFLSLGIKVMLTFQPP